MNIIMMEKAMITGNNKIKLPYKFIRKNHMKDFKKKKFRSCFDEQMKIF